jgi:hypothetical protein
VIAIGIDPGASDGALVVLDIGTGRATVVDALAWSIAKRKHGDVMRVWTPDAGETGAHPEIFRGGRVGGIGVHLTHRIDRAAVEGHPPRMGGRAHGMNLGHVREIGRVCGWVEALTGITPETPPPAVWRRRVFGIPPGTGAKACDAMILARLPALVTLPDGIPPWAMKHLPDACGVALSLRTA